jgi:anti-sigma factor RsiW
MDCDDFRALLHRYVDDELPPALRDEAAAHIGDCAECRRLVQEQQAWHQAIRRAGSYYDAPDLVRRRVAEMARRRAPSASIARWRGWAMAASLVLAVALSSGVTAYLVAPSPGEPVAEQVVASHVRSLMADHLTDVASSNEHTVKPWFHGKLDFAPPVEDLAAQGFPLIGGRLDYIDGRSTAALVYRYAQHPINLFIFPAKGPDTAATAEIEDGYNILHWRAGGMAFWAVSDLEAKELADFAKLVRQKG